MAPFQQRRCSGPGSACPERLLWTSGPAAAWEALAALQQRGEGAGRRVVSRLLKHSRGGRGAKPDAELLRRGLRLAEAHVEMSPGDVDEVLCNEILDACSHLGDLARLERARARMAELGVAPSAVTLGILVKAYGKAGQARKVLQVWEEMREQRAEAGIVTYGCMVEACVRCRRLSAALALFDELRVQGRHRNTILYCTIIKGHGMEGEHRRALSLFREMASEGVAYNSVAYNTMLDVCVNCGRMDEAEELLREMATAGGGMAPDLVSFSTLLKGYCQRLDLESAFRLLEEMRRRRLACDALAYGTLMEACARAGDHCAALGLLEEMLQQGKQVSPGALKGLRGLFKGEAARAAALLLQEQGIRPAPSRGPPQQPQQPRPCLLLLPVYSAAGGAARLGGC